MEKKGTLGQKRRPKGDPNPQKGPPSDPNGHSANTPSDGNFSYGGHCWHVNSCSPCTNVPSTHPTKSVTGDPLWEVDAAYLSNLWWRILCNARKLLERKRAKLCKVLKQGRWDIWYSVPVPSSGPSLVKSSDLVAPLLKYEDVHAQIYLFKTCNYC